MEVAREEAARGGAVENQRPPSRIVRLSPEVEEEIRRRWGSKGRLSDIEAEKVIDLVLEDLKRQADKRDRQREVQKRGEPEEEREELPKAA